MKKLKIALVINDDFSMWHFRRGLIAALVKRQLDVYIITPPGPYVQKIEQLGCTHIPVSMNRFISPVQDIVLFIMFLKIFRKMRFDIIHTMTIKPNIYATIAAHLTGCNQIYSLVSGLGHMFSSEVKGIEKILQPLVQLLYNFGLSYCQRVWFQNQEDSQFFIEKKIIPPSKALVIKSGGINLQEYSPSTLDTMELSKLSEELGITKNYITFTMITARLVWSKGVKEFIEAAEIILSTHSKVHFILLGPYDPSSPESIPLDYLKEKGSHNLKTLTSFRRDVKEIIGISSVIVLPSYYREGVPRILLEALAMAKPIITTDNVGCKEVVENNRNGYIVPIKNSKALAKAIENLIENKNLIKEFGEYSRKKAQLEFDEDVIVEKIIHHLYQLEEN